MKRAVPLALLLLPLPLFAGDAPGVVSTTPVNGATPQPGASELKVVFDRPMRTNTYGFMKDAGGKAFPAVAGGVRWADEKTCVVPVRLTAGTEYVVGINTRGSTRFQARDGTPAKPFVLRFRARGQAATPEKKRAAVETLRKAIDERYSHRDRLARDWKQLFAKHEGGLVDAKSPRAFADAAAKLLAIAEDPHISLQVSGDYVGTYQRKVVPNFSLAGIKAAVPNLRQRSRCVFTGTLDAQTGYVLIGSWARERAQDLQVLGAVMRELAKLPRLVVDVRANGGGDETIAQRFAGQFVAEPVVYARHVVRDPSAKGGFTPPRDRVLQPVAPRYTGKVAVLIGPHVMSSAEGFVLMMKQIPGVVLVGASTYGSSGNPQPHDLGNGVTVLLPSWRALTPKGAEIEGQGISPDVVVGVAPGVYASDDPVIAAAMAVFDESK